MIKTKHRANRALLLITIVAMALTFWAYHSKAEELAVQEGLKSEIVDDCNELTKQVVLLEKQNKLLEERAESQNALIDRLMKLETGANAQSLGEFTITHYCSCEKCCGKSNGITATGTVATDGRTIAVDPQVIPLGSKVQIDGHEYIAEDVGQAIQGNKVDIYVGSHEKALSRGKLEREVWTIADY